MKKLILIPDKWQCLIEECPPGLFVYDGRIGFKSEYRTNNGDIEAFNEAGEYFCPRNVMVQPVLAEWEDEG